MPLYEFICEDCHTQFDALVRNREAADEVMCRSCTGENVRRLISAIAPVAGMDDPRLANTLPQGGCCGGSCGCGH